MPAFAKSGLIRRNPPVQVGEGTCQVQRRQPVLIRYQIREVSGSRRTGATLLFLADPKPLPTNSSPKTLPLHFTSSTHSINYPLHPTRLSCHSFQNHQSLQRFPGSHVARQLWQLEVLLIFCQHWALWIRWRASNFCREYKVPFKKASILMNNSEITLCKPIYW